MTHDQLATLIRKVSADINDAGPATIQTLVQPLREHVKPDCYVGRAADMDHTDAGYRMQLEWYAGQLLDMVDNQQWLGINSWIGCTEKFTTRRT